jgi:hypothetical protein
MPKRSRKTLAALLIVIVGVVAGSSLLWWYNQRTAEEELMTFSDYGFSFKYPRELEISEESATDESGMLIGTVTHDKGLEFIKVGWMTLESSPGVESLLDTSFMGMEDEGFIVQPGQMKNHTSAKGYEMLYQYFSGTDAESIPLEGITGVWYCSTSQRSFEFILIFVDIQQDINSKFLQYINSFTCN